MESSISECSELIFKDGYKKGFHEFVALMSSFLTIPEMKNNLFLLSLSNPPAEDDIIPTDRNDYVLSEEEIKQVTCDTIRLKYGLRDRCKMCPYSKEYANARAESEKKLIVRLLMSEPRKRFFPDDDTIAAKSVQKLTAYMEYKYEDQVLYTQIYRDIYEALYSLVARQQLAKAKKPLYESVTAEEVMYVWGFKHATAADDAFKNDDILTYIKALFGEAAALREKREHSSQVDLKTEKSKDKEIFDWYFPVPKKKKTPLPEPTETQIVNLDAKKDTDLSLLQKMQSDDGQISKGADTSADIAQYDIVSRINDDWIREKRLRTVTSEGDTSDFSFSMLKYSTVAVEAVYNTDHHAYGCIALFPDDTKHRDFYFSEEYALPYKCLAYFLGAGKLFRKVTSDVVALSAVCSRSSIILKHAAEIKTTAPGENNIDKAMSYIDAWSSLKTLHMPKENFYYKRALGREMFSRDLSTVSLKITGTGRYVFLCVDRPSDDELIYQISLVENAGREGWVDCVKTLTSLFEENRVLTKYHARLHNVDEKKRAIQYLLPIKYYRDFHTLTARSMMNIACLKLGFYPTFSVETISATEIKH